jgi:hydroxymethylpyrimidine pyrophosphatase-like HAD family hydrolase
MKYLALACDYDGTIAHEGRVDDATFAALERVRASRRRLILVTGRELPHLREDFPRLDLFDIIVAENGAMIYQTDTQETTLLAKGPPQGFVDELRRRGVDPISQGEIIVATWTPHETKVVEVIRDQGLELQVLFNKGAVMVLPSGVNKATGLQTALGKLKLSVHNTVGVGDAENDHAFLTVCECSVAVANALPSLKEHVDVVTTGKRGKGVAELIGEILESDLSGREEGLRRSRIPLGRGGESEEISLRPFDDHLLIAGQSGSGKSTLAISFLEGLAERGYQFCLVDPEGDYEGVERAVVLGDPDHTPTVEEVLALLEQPDTNVVVNLLNVGIDRRPAYFEELLEGLRPFFARTGRPHRLILDEVHHLMPPSAPRAATLLRELCQALVMVTVHPEHVATEALSLLDYVAVIGMKREQILEEFAKPIGSETPATPSGTEEGEAWFWKRSEKAIVRFRPRRPRAAHKRHQRKYAEGELPEERCFYFTGPQRSLRLKAQNLMVFLQIAEGVDDLTWKYHLERGDYSKWFRTSIKDSSLADDVEPIEAARDISPSASRERVREEIEKRYTAPA